MNITLSETTIITPSTAPYTITFSLSGFSESAGKVMSIKCNFPNRESVVFHRTLNRVSTPETSFINDPNDPRNETITNTFFSTSESLSTSFTVEVMRINNFRPTVYSYDVILNKTPAWEMHIIDSRIYGEDNKQVIALESEDPRYVVLNRIIE